MTEKPEAEDQPVVDVERLARLGVTAAECAEVLQRNALALAEWMGMRPLAGLRLERLQVEQGAGSTTSQEGETSNATE